MAVNRVGAKPINLGKKHEGQWRKTLRPAQSCMAADATSTSATEAPGSMPSSLQGPPMASLRRLLDHVTSVVLFHHSGRHHCVFTAGVARRRVWRWPRTEDRMRGRKLNDSARHLLTAPRRWVIAEGPRGLRVQFSPSWATYGSVHGLARPFVLRPRERRSSTDACSADLPGLASQASSRALRALLPKRSGPTRHGGYAWSPLALCVQRPHYLLTIARTEHSTIVARLHLWSRPAPSLIA